MGWAPWGWQQTTGIAPEWPRGDAFLLSKKRLTVRGWCGNCAIKLKLKEEQKRQEKDTPLPLARLSINSSYTKSIIRNIWVHLALECYRSILWFSRVWQAPSRQPAHVSYKLSTYCSTTESLMMLTSILFCYSDYSGHRLQADSHWVSFVWSLHFKKFSTCCQQHLKFEQFYVKIQVGNSS